MKHTWMHTRKVCRWELPPYNVTKKGYFVYIHPWNARNCANTSAKYYLYVYPWKPRLFLSVPYLKVCRQNKFVVHLVPLVFAQIRVAGRAHAIKQDFEEYARNHQLCRRVCPLLNIWRDTYTKEPLSRKGDFYIHAHSDYANSCKYFCKPWKTLCICVRSPRTSVNTKAMWFV